MIMTKNLLPKALIVGAALALSGCVENVYNTEASIFPPIEGAAKLPSQAQGFYYGTGVELLRPLSDYEQAVFNQLSPSQKRRALLFINTGGTLFGSFGSDI